MTNSINQDNNKAQKEEQTDQEVLFDKSSHKTVRSDMEWFVFLQRLTSKARKKIFLTSIFVNTLALASPIFVLQVYDKVVYHQGIDTLQALVLIMLVVILFEYLLRLSRHYLLHSVSTKIDIYSSSKLFKHITNLPLRILESHSVDFWQMMFKDINLVRSRLSGPIALAIMDFPFAFLMLFLVLIISPYVFWVPVLFTIVILIIVYRSEKTLAKKVAQEELAVLAKQGSLQDILDARLTVKSMQMQSVAFEKWAEKQNNLIHKSLSRARSNDLYENMAQSIGMLSGVILIAAGALVIVDGKMTIGGLIAANMLSAKAIGIMARLISQWKHYRESIEAQKRLNNIFTIQKDKQQTKLNLAKPIGKITFKKVNYTYSQDKKVAINDFSGIFEPNLIYTIIGSNGSGKSTLLKLIRGLYRPQSGDILIDEYDQIQFGQEDLASWIGYMPQETALITGSFHDNITFGMTNKQVSDQDVIDAAKLAECHTDIASLKNGYETSVGRNGFELSPGFRQKICLARIYIRKPRIILLDEPTNHLDQVSLNRLIQSLKILATNSTIVIVSHNLSILKASDILIQIDEGKLKRFGNYDTVAQAIENEEKK